jgi:hypothetical protein
MKERVLFITRPDQKGPAEEAAIEYAASNGLSMVVLFIIDSPMFHYGRNDWVCPGYARSQFLFHIRYDLLRQACEREIAMRTKADLLGLEMRVAMVEADDFEAAVIKEAAKGYDRVFVNREKKKRFPLFGNRTLETTLQREGFGNVVAC